MKISLDDYDKIHGMSRNQLSKFLVSLEQSAFEKGLRAGESELDGADAEGWKQFIDKTPMAREVFSIWDSDELEERLSREFTRENVARIMNVILSP